MKDDIDMDKGSTDLTRYQFYYSFIFKHKEFQV